jgi:hypothetical protein
VMIAATPATNNIFFMGCSPGFIKLLKQYGASGFVPVECLSTGPIPDAPQRGFGRRWKLSVWRSAKALMRRGTFRLSPRYVCRHKNGR